MDTKIGVRHWLTILLVWLLAGCGASPPAPDTSTPVVGGSAPESINIGGAFALTGGGSALDQPASNGAALAVKEINAAGGVLGQPLALVLHDSQYDMKVTEEIARQFVTEDNVKAVIGFSDTDSVLAAAPITQEARIPFITSGATSPKLPDQIGDLLFLACFGDNVQAAAGAEFGYRQLGKTAYLLQDKDIEYTVLLANYFKQSFTALGGTIVLEDEYANDATDFSAQIAKVKALPSQPDFYYISAVPSNVGLVIKQFRDAGLTGPIIGGDGYDTPDLIGQAGTAAENVFFSTHVLVDSTRGTQRIKDFITAYQAEFGHQPENAFAALGYDAVYLLADAIKRAGSTEAEAIKKALEGTTSFEGTTGSIRFSPESHVPQKSVTIIAVKDGNFTLGAEIVPSQVPPP